MLAELLNEKKREESILVESGSLPVERESSYEHTPEVEERERERWKKSEEEKEVLSLLVTPWGWVRGKICWSSLCWEARPLGMKIPPALRGSVGPAIYPKLLAFVLYRLEKNSRKRIHCGTSPALLSCRSLLQVCLSLSSLFFFSSRLPFFQESPVLHSPRDTVTGTANQAPLLGLLSLLTHALSPASLFPALRPSSSSSSALPPAVLPCTVSTAAFFSIARCSFSLDQRGSPQKKGRAKQWTASRRRSW